VVSRDRHAFSRAAGQAPHQREPVHVGHVLVRDDEIAGGRRGAIQSLGAVFGLDHAVTGRLEDKRDHLSHRGGVVDG
jgi:hypothetical protein